MTSTEFDQIYLKTFNPQQIEAVHSVDGAVLLLAVPGSGKTTVLVTRLGYMIHCHGIPAQRILTMTYTVAATVEMRQRFVDLFGKDIADGMQFAPSTACPLRSSAVTPAPTARGIPLS